jgi:Helix-turn-helix family
VTYDDIAAAFLIPPAEPIPAPELPTTPARRLRDALEPIATQGWWSRPAADRVVALGLGFFDGYVWGRAAALGDPAPSVVVATFGVFEPTMLTAVLELGRSAASRDDVLAARAEGATESLLALVSAEDADAIAEPLLDALAAIDGMGRPLFGGLRELPLPATAQGRLWRAAELVREHRGDGHLAACIAAGLDAVTTNVLTELWLGFGLGEYSGTRGFGPDALAGAVRGLEGRGWAEGTTLTPAGRTARLAIEEATDASQADLVAALGDRLDEIVERAERVSSSVLEARAFPHDPRKRAAG